MSFLLLFIWCLQCIDVCPQSTYNNPSTVAYLDSSDVSTFTPASSAPISETFMVNVSPSDGLGLNELLSTAGNALRFHTSSESTLRHSYLINVIDSSSLEMLSNLETTTNIYSTRQHSSHMSLTSSIVDAYSSPETALTSSFIALPSLNEPILSFTTSETLHPSVLSTTTSPKTKLSMLGSVDDVSASFSHMTGGSISETALSSVTGQGKDEASFMYGIPTSNISNSSTVSYTEVSPSLIETRASMTYSSSKESLVERTRSSETTSVFALIVTSSKILDTLVTSSPFMKTVQPSFTSSREDHTETSHFTSSPMSVTSDTVSSASIIESSINSNPFETHVTNYTVNLNEPVHVSSTHQVIIPTSHILPVSEFESIHVSETDITYSHAFSFAVSTSHSSSFVDVSTHVTHGIGRTYRVVLLFQGSCGRLHHSDQLKIEFLKALVDIIRNFVPELTDNDFELEQLICNPFKVELLLKNIRDDDCLSQLSFSVRNLTVNVPIIDRSVVNYHAVGIQVMSIINGTNNGGEMKQHGLDTSDIVVIVISTLLFAFLIALGGIVICRECYKRKRAASFNLLDVPHVNLKLDEFTLTRIPRPTMTFFDNRANGRHRQENGDSISRNDGEQKENLNSDTIRVRMLDHSDGVVIGVTCSRITNEAPSPTSDKSLPCMDQSEQTLLTYNRSREGTLNPSCNVDDEVIPHNAVCIHEDDKVEFL